MAPLASRGVGPVRRGGATTGQAHAGWRASWQGSLTHASEIGRDIPLGATRT